MSVKCIPPYTPFLYSRSGVCRGIPIFLRNIDCGYSLEPPQCTHNQCFEQKYEKYQTFPTENFQFLKTMKKSVYHMGMFSLSEMTIVTNIICRIKDSSYLVDAFNVDPIYLRHENEGRVPDYRVRLAVHLILP